MPALPIDFDGAWKEGLDTLRPDTLALLFRPVHAAIGRSHPPEFLLRRRGL